MALHSIRDRVTSTSGVTHSGAILHLLECVERSSFLRVKCVKTSLLNDESDDFKGFLITPIVNLGHGEIIQEAEHFFVSNRPVDTGLMFGDFTFNTELEVRRSGSTREIDSLERLNITIKLFSIHEDNRSLSSTRSTNK